VAKRINPIRLVCHGSEGYSESGLLGLLRKEAATENKFSCTKNTCLLITVLQHPFALCRRGFSLHVHLWLLLTVPLCCPAEIRDLPTIARPWVLAEKSAIPHYSKSPSFVIFVFTTHRTQPCCFCSSLRFSASPILPYVSCVNWRCPNRWL
jgi:hypothetical protein